MNHSFETHWIDKTLHCEATIPLRFAVSAIHRLEAAAIRLNIDPAQEFRLRFSITGDFTARFWRDHERRWRLRIFRRDGSDCGAPVSVEARLLTPLDEPESLSCRIYSQALAAIRKTYRTELSRRYQTCSDGAALFDLCFSPGREGRDAFRNALGGELACEVPDAGVLTHDLDRYGAVELHLPLVKPRYWTPGLASLAEADVTGGEEGRLLLYNREASAAAEANNFVQAMMVALAGAGPGACPITYTDQRRLPAIQWSGLATLLKSYGFGSEVEEWLATLPGRCSEIDTTLTLSLPGECAAVWHKTPLERDRDFSRVYGRMSVAVQRAMRRWLPFVYFSDLDRYDTRFAAYSLLIYQLSHPFVADGSTQFSYDAISDESTAQARRTAWCHIKQELVRVRRLLQAAGRHDSARRYGPKRLSKAMAIVQRHPHSMDGLLYADSVFVNQLIQFGIHCRRSVSERLEKSLGWHAGKLAEALHTGLRHLFEGLDLLPFASLLVVEATYALNAALRFDAELQAVLTVQAPGFTRTFVAKRVTKRRRRVRRAGAC